MNHLKKIFYLLKSKKIWKLPEQKEILILDEEGSKKIEGCLLGHSNYNILFDKYKKINILILLFGIFYFWKYGKYFYEVSFIKFAKPKIAITFLDTSYYYGNILKFIPTCKLMLIQNGRIGSYRIDLLKNLKNKIDYYAVNGELQINFFNKSIGKNLLSGVRAEKKSSLEKAFILTQPDVVINCIGIIKQLDDLSDPLQIIEINAFLPHQLAKLCKLIGSRLIHISTDCVFDGEKGDYKESDSFNAKDLYGISKYLGEVSYSHTVTLRTSIIGHELQSKHSLVDWFLSQEENCKGYARAIFSGLPTFALAEIIRDVVIPHIELSGVYHVGSKSINKYDLLKLIAQVYGKSIQIIPDDNLVINRSLNTDKFLTATDCVIPEWPELIQKMYDYK